MDRYSLAFQRMSGRDDKKAEYWGASGRFVTGHRKANTVTVTKAPTGVTEAVAQCAPVD